MRIKEVLAIACPVNSIVMVKKVIAMARTTPAPASGLKSSDTMNHFRARKLPQMTLEVFPTCLNPVLIRLEPSGTLDKAGRSRNKQILTLVCLSLYGLMLVEIVSRTMIQYNQLQKHIYNFYFAQPKEFTLCLKVYNSQISAFLKDVHQENQGNFGKQFQNHVRREVQNALRIVYQQTRGSEAPRDFFDICLCQLSYRNKQTIDFLTERGNAIRSRDVDKVKECLASESKPMWSRPNDYHHVRRQSGSCPLA